MTTSTLDRAALARLIDHTLLKPEATAADVAALCAEARRLAVFSVCISPSMLPLPPDLLPAGIATVTVIGFPSGAHRGDVKAAEAARAVRDGADEVDMVVNLGLVRAGDWTGVTRDIAAVRTAAPPPVGLKVILESAALDETQLAAACQAAEEAGADFVKTSTGFHPAGGASVAAVRVMAASVGGRLGIKASGGIRTIDAALAFIEAGATRLGLSGTAAVLAGLPPTVP